MQKPLFNLKRHFYSNVFCFAVPNYKKSTKHFQPDEVFDIKARIFPPTERKGTWCVSLEISTKEKCQKEIYLPYVIDLKSFAFFESLLSTEIIDPEKLAELIFINGATMMYASAREYLRMISASGPYGTLILPTWRFSPEDMKTVTKPQEPEKLEKPENKNQKDTKTKKTKTKKPEGNQGTPK